MVVSKGNCETDFKQDDNKHFLRNVVKAVDAVELTARDHPAASPRGMKASRRKGQMGATYPPIPTVKARSDQSLSSMIGISLPI